MSGHSNLAYECGMQEDVFSGGGQYEDEQLKRLVADYSQIDQRRWHLSPRNETTQEDSVNDETLSFNLHHDQNRIDELAIPFSMRKADALRLSNQRSLTPLIEWEGYVESIEGDEFRLRLVNIASGNAVPDEEAVFSMNDLSFEQKSRLAVGSIVRWVIGYERLASDQRRRVSELHFRRLPAHTEKDYKRAFARADDLISAIDWDESS